MGGLLLRFDSSIRLARGGLVRGTAGFAAASVAGGANAARISVKDRSKLANVDVRDAAGAAGVVNALLHDSRGRRPRPSCRSALTMSRGVEPEMARGDCSVYFFSEEVSF